MTHQLTRAMLFGALASVLLIAHAWAADKRPNVIFIFTDDHAAHAIGAYGSKINKTPNIDRLAKEGMRFDHCLVTNSICGPSRAVILTGKYSHLNGFYRNGNLFDGGQQTFPKLLQKAGYQTAMIGKWHLSSDPTGFDYWEVLPGQGAYYNPVMIKNGERLKYTGYTTDIITDRALDWLKEKRDKDKPFMLMYQHKAPHRRWEPGPKHLTMYDGQTIPEPDTLFDDYAGRTKANLQQQMTIAKHLSGRDLKFVPPGNLTAEQLKLWNAAYGPKNEAYKKAKEEGKLTERQDTQWKYQRYIKDYLRCVASVDDNIGRILKYLEEENLEDNTIVIYSSDQGWYLGDHGWYDKRWMYEESLLMPLIVKWPGTVKPGSVNKQMVSNVDFAETFLDIAGVEAPNDMQGQSMVPLLKGETPDDWRKSFYYHYYEFPGPHAVAKHYGVRTDRYKLIHFYRLGDWELYDLKKDPDELKSVYGDPDYAEIQAKLKVELKRLQEEVGEPEPTKPVPGDPDYRKTMRKVKVRLAYQLDAEKLGDGKTVATPAGPAFEVDGRSALQPKPTRPDVAMVAFSAGGWVMPTAGDGVVIAQGGASQGFSLYLKDGKPRFAVRSSDALVELVDDATLPQGQWAHVLGVLDDEQELRLYVNGKLVGKTKGRAIASLPQDVLSVGGDTGSLVGDYPGAMAWQGLLRDVRLYRGALDARQIGGWAGE